MQTMTDISPNEQAVLEVLRRLGRMSRAELEVELGGFISQRQLSVDIAGLQEKSLVTPTRDGWVTITPAGNRVLPLRQEDEMQALDKVLPHPGMSAFGHVAVGQDVNSQTRHWQLVDDMGARPCVVIGRTGSGKTGVLAGLIESMAGHREIVRTWVIDPSYQLDEYRDKVEQTVHDRESIAALLDQVIRVQFDRARMLAEAGRRTWTSPFEEPKLPLGLLIIEELDGVVRDNEMREKLAQICQAARRTGIVVAAAAFTVRAESFGGPMLRDLLLDGGNAIFLASSQPGMAHFIREDLPVLTPIPEQFRSGATTAGVGQLIDGTLIRTYWPSGL